MRKFASAVVATLGVAGVLLSAQLANADSVKGSIELAPVGGLPGESVVFTGVCTDPGFKSAPLSSGGAFNPVNVTRVEKAANGDTTLVEAYPVVAKNAKPGKYTVSFMCGSAKVRANYFVLSVARKPAPTTTKKPAAPQVTVKPKGSANTGDGSTAE